MKAHLYQRRSKADVASPEQLMIPLKSYAEMRGWEVAGEYLDVADHANAARPQGKRLLQGLIKDPIGHALILSSFHRLWKSSDELALWLGRLLSAGLHIVAIDSLVDTTMPADRLRLLEAAKLFRDFHRRRRSEGIRIGILQSRLAAQGLWGQASQQPLINLMEVRNLWEARGLSQREIVRILTRRGAKVSKTYLQQFLKRHIEAGDLNPEKHQRTYLARKDRLRGGRPKNKTRKGQP